MRRNYRFIILACFFISNNVYALKYFVDALEWRATETNNWAYINSETLPSQTLGYQTIDFHYNPGIRIGVSYIDTWDALASFTHFDTTTNDSASGLIRPAFVGSVTAQPSAADLYHTGQVSQSIHYNIFDVNVGKEFHPAKAWMLHPIAGLMGGWIDQTIQAAYQQPSTSTNEVIDNDFSGLGPKAGVDTSITLFNYHDYEPKLIAAFAASYLVGSWQITDVTNVVPARRIDVTGSSQCMGALTFQGSIGLALNYKKLSAKLVYEINDWLNQTQFFDNDTGTHNNDLILQGVTLGFSYDL